VLATAAGDWVLFGLAVAWAGVVFGFVGVIVAGFAAEWWRARVSA
jgi:hypothetical protein